MSIPAMASHNEFAPKYNAIKLMFAGGVCGAAQTAFIHACAGSFGAPQQRRG